MYLKTQKKDTCTGCGACAQVCPKKCIELVEDEDGFRYPKKDTARCIKCYKCEDVCSYNNFPESTNQLSEKVVIAAVDKSEEQLLQSASGGAFYNIAKCLLKNDSYYICGGGYDEKLKVKHICSYGEQYLQRIVGSKYVQSDMSDCYKSIKEQLGNDNKVLFSGTPCQVAALRNYLNLNKINADNLVCVEILCHGAPSQKIFDEYLSDEEKRYNSEIVNVKFRYKFKILGKWTTRNIALFFADGRTKVFNRFQSSYLRAYHSGLMNRESCYKCLFSSPERSSDLTIGDFWNIRQFYPELDPYHGVSIVQANTKKGLEVLNSLKSSMDWWPIEKTALAGTSSRQLVIAVNRKMPKDRDKLLRIRRQSGLNKAVNKIFPFRIDFIRFILGKIKHIKIGKKKTM